MTPPNMLEWMELADAGDRENVAGLD